MTRTITRSNDTESQLKGIRDKLELIRDKRSNFTLHALVSLEQASRCLNSAIDEVLRTPAKIDEVESGDEKQ
jgi:hypothetical protein